VSLPNLADQKTIRFLLLPPQHDPDSFVREQGREVFEQALAEARPLSSFFLDELKRRVDTATPEGRSRLIHEAKPLLQKVAAPALQLQLLKSLAEVARMTQEEAAQLCEIRVARGFGGAYSSKPAPARNERAPMQSVEIWLLKCLMVKPELARELPMERFRGDGFECRALQEFVSFAQEITEPVSSLDALIIERFQGKEFEALFKRLQKETIGVNLTPEQVDAEFRDALPNLERQHVKERIDEWKRQAEQRTLGPEECSQLVGLTQRLRELDRSRAGTPPVL
jgi:DNA primase